MNTDIHEHGAPGDQHRQAALVIHPEIRGNDLLRDADSALAEAVSLAQALPGIQVMDGLVVRLPRAQPGMLFGSGKVDELKTRIEADEIDLVLIDGPVSPVQQRNLEKAWGVKLLRRTTRAVSLTEPGQQAYEHAVQIPRLAALAEESAASLSHTPRGRLRVTASVSFGQHMLVPLLPAFAERYPQVVVELHLLDRLVDLVDEGFDVGIRLSEHLPEGLVARKLGDIRYRVCASPRLRGIAGLQRPVDLLALPALRFSGRRAKHPWVLSQGEERVSLQPQGRITANTSDALAMLAVAGQGVAMLPDYVTHAALARGELVELLPDWTAHGPFGDAFWAVRAPERRALPKVSAFTEFVAAAIGRP